jgi:predicted dehydrogenase
MTGNIRVGHVATKLEQLLECVDAVAVVTPDRHHAEPSVAVLWARKHLLCEKPLTVTLTEARLVAAEAKKASRHGVMHMVNFSYRGLAAFQRAIEAVATGTLGELRRVQSFYLQSWLSSDVWGNLTKESLLWRLKTTAGSGGLLGDLGCHILDMTTAVAGDVKRVRCELRTFPKLLPDSSLSVEWHGERLDANDTAVIELELVNGALAVAQTTRRAVGTEGALMFDLDRDYSQIDFASEPTSI